MTNQLRVWLCGGALVVGFLAAVVGDVAFGLSPVVLAQTFQVTNLMLGLPAGLCGLIMAWHRPGNRLGWLLIGAGLATVVMAASVPWLVTGLERGWSPGVLRTLSTTTTAWTACQFLFLPMSVLLFPDGRVPGPRWRWVPWFLVIAFVVELVQFGSVGNAVDSVPAYQGIDQPTWFAIPALAGNPVFEIGAAIIELGVYVLLLLGLAVRYRSGDDARRRQLLWLLWATVVALVLIVVDVTAVRTGGTTTILLLGLIGLVPVAMTVAVLRHQVLDIRLVWSRTVAWLLLTAGVLGLYFALVWLGEALLQDHIPAAAPAAVIVAACFHPARMRLQRLVETRMYGDRADPVRVATRVAAELSTRIAEPADMLAPLCTALRLPYAELRGRGGTIASHGLPVTTTESVPLRHGGADLGELVVGVRSGQRRLDPQDRSVLALVAAPLALAMHATALSGALRAAASEVTSSRVAERHRLRNDLHDSIGPLLTGIAFHAEAAGHDLRMGSGDVRTSLERIQATTVEAIAEVRTLLESLRPASVEELGLVGAIEGFAAGVRRRGDGEELQVVVNVADLPELATEVETALFRITTEAVTNALRHSDAERVDVELGADAVRITLTVSDDGGPSDDWCAGVGLRSMRERAALVGGTLRVGPGRIGGEVRLEVPV